VISHLDIEVVSPEQFSQKPHEHILANIASLNMLCLFVHFGGFGPAGGDQISLFFFTSFFLLRNYDI